MKNKTFGRFFDAKMWEKKTIIDESQFIQVWHGIIPKYKKENTLKIFHCANGSESKFECFKLSMTDTI